MTVPARSDRRLKALLWDVDGTLAETERDGHRIAFNAAFAACGIDWRWDETHYGRLLHVTGGRERLLHDMTGRHDAPALADERDALARKLHAQKNRLYAEQLAAHAIPLRDGVEPLLREALAAGLRLGIATTTSRSNVDALLRGHLGPRWATHFAAIVCGEDVAHKKPDPEVYRKALEALRIGPLDAVAIEDSPGGAAAARAADVPVIVTRSAYFQASTFEGAIAIGPHFGDRRGWKPAPAASAESRITLADIEGWHAQMDIVSQVA